MTDTSQERLAAFRAALELAMKQYNCTLSPWCRKDTGGETWGFDMVALDDPAPEDGALTDQEQKEE